MQKPTAYLLIVGGILAAGVFLSFYGAQLSTQDLAVKEENVLSGGSLEISTELDPSKSDFGVFVIQILEDKESTLIAKISDPLWFEILSIPIEKESVEEQFEISSKGTYQLIVQNTGLQDLQVVGAFGHMPDTMTISVGITGFYLLIVGIIGIIGVGIYAIRIRKKFS